MRGGKKSMRGVRKRNLQRRHGGERKGSWKRKSGEKKGGDLTLWWKRNEKEKSGGEGRRETGRKGGEMKWQLIEGFLCKWWPIWPLGEPLCRCLQRSQWQCSLGIYNPVVDMLCNNLTQTIGCAISIRWLNINQLHIHGRLQCEILLHSLCVIVYSLFFL